MTTKFKKADRHGTEKCTQNQVVITRDTRSETKYKEAGSPTMEQDHNLPCLLPLDLHL